MIKRRIITVAAILVMAALGAPAGLAVTKIVNRIIARVNNEIVTQRQFEQKQRDLRNELAQHYSGADLETQYRQKSADMLRSMIDEDLLVQKAKDDDINVETDVVKEMDQIREENHLASLQDLEKAIEAQGMIWEDYQDQMRRQLLMQRVIEREVGSRITPTRDVALKYFQDHLKDFASPAGLRLAEIRISTDNRKPEEADKRAQDALAELKSGAKWEDVVKKYSDDNTNGPSGDIGFFPEGTLAPVVASAVAKLDVNDYSNVVKTSHGDLILRVLEIRSGGTPKFEEVESRVDEALYQQRIQVDLRNYLARLRCESYVTVAPAFMDSGAAKCANAPSDEPSAEPAEQ
ncbi:MAG TPA: peptidyl-prolyl cis-trans isomerase [Terriglobia bacterium]|nr:peptidyl-prolyl cis-trans isomerase [Terriglobia bacterium]